MKSEVGKYVRYDGKFFKLNENYLKKWIGYFGITQVKYKARYRIIDLVEVGDYVNGYKVLEIYTNIAKEKVLRIQTEYKTKDDMSIPYETPFVTNENIKSIVTKEQFDSMKYEVSK